jgi:hypothetical protein
MYRLEIKFLSTQKSNELKGVVHPLAMRVVCISVLAAAIHVIS